MEKMILSLVLCCLCFWRLDVLFADADAVESVSVNEGDPVTLNSDLTNIMDDDVIQWMFKHKSIAKICARDGRIILNEVPNGRFAGRLKLDNETGSLTITDTRPEHSGVYELLTNSVRKSFILRVLPCSSCTSSDIHEMSGTEGTSFHLGSDLKLTDDDLIQWRFGTENSLIAEVTSNRSTVYDDVLDGRFRDRLKVHNQTGSLEIVNMTTEHNGIYEVLHNSVRKMSCILTVYAHLPSGNSTDCLLSSPSVSELKTHLENDALGQPYSECVSGCDSAEAVMRLVVTALVGVAAAAAVVVLVCDIRSRRD